MENLKHTKEYAEKVAMNNSILPIDDELIWIDGYMKAIEETNVAELLEALIELTKAVIELDKYKYEVHVKDELTEKCKRAINKANK